ncbi:MAG: hybrid sensory histidine kinase BarA [Candidatus Syntrophoarchaeum sp. GoM_oil]|nr:MAG: hybrid sensory histidine kinase BarA [Candidatus Syntrophoarchaeum sp. GoM_oil]
MEYRHPFVGPDLEKKKPLILFIVIILCVILDIYVTFIIGKEIVYTHFFYIPLVLGGIWYYTDAVYIALFLGVVHIFTILVTKDFGIVTLEAMQRTAIFIIVAFIIGFVSERQAKTLLAEEKNRFEEIRKSEEKYRSLVESTEDSVYLVNSDCEYLFMNKQHISRLGLSNNQFQGRNYREFHSEEETKDFAEKINYVFKTRFSLQREHESSDEKYFIRTLSPVKDPGIGKVTAVTVVSKDITERKHAEEEIQKLNKKLELRVMDLEEITRMKTQFLSMTSHELRTPLTPIKAQLQMLQEGYMGELNKKQEHGVEVTLRNVGRLDNLINDMMDISRIEAGRTRMSFDRMNLNDVVNEAIKMQEPFTREKGLKITAQLAELPTVIGDAERLRQVISNLLDNALKFSGKSPDINVETKKEGENVLFRITDHGIGISKEDWEKLFEPFSQIDTSMGRVYGGSGLGLAIAKGFVEAHGGKIWLESKPGNGSSFYFSIPIKEEIREKEVIIIKKDVA